MFFVYQEYWLTEELAGPFIPSHFVSANIMCRTYIQNGVAAIFMKKGIYFELIDLFDIST